MKNLGKSNSRSRIVDENDPAIASSAMIYSSTAAVEPLAPRTICSPRSTQCSSPLRRRTPCGRSSSVSSEGPNSPTTGQKHPQALVTALGCELPSNSNQAAEIHEIEVDGSINLVDNEISMRKSGQLGF
ncbi:PAS domain-containing protein tyrosine kinasefamily protein [Striga asiatica]|uniref:PAS domain-containing protein tyrosine kinasefamily protein n=1 Tax=Striga asiatica TaxID=4170 RepID=A0A5A7R118_STRAF|nr:PAS domain-containing protein tyrosine kinasefamily protein [Striga asiatica]